MFEKGEINGIIHCLDFTPSQNRIPHNQYLCEKKAYIAKATMVISRDHQFTKWQYGYPQSGDITIATDFHQHTIINIG